MATKIMYAISNLETELNKKIFCGDLDKNDYETKYKGKLTCIKGCPARIKFTERKNNIKFFSTWNKEGHLHSTECPYHVDYKGKVGRKRLIAQQQSIELSDEIILRRLQQKMERLLNEVEDKDIIDPLNGTREVEETGEREVIVYEGNENGAESTRMPNIRYEDAEYISTDDIGCRKSVYGFIDNVQIEEDKYHNKYAYFNLATKHTVVNIAFPEAFYSQEGFNGVEEFEIFISKVKAMVEQHPQEIRVIVYGDVTKKKRDKNGVNISVLSPNRILVDNKTYRQIVYEM